MDLVLDWCFFEHLTLEVLDPQRKKNPGNPSLSSLEASLLLLKRLLANYAEQRRSVERAREGYRGRVLVPDTHHSSMTGFESRKSWRLLCQPNKEGGTKERSRIKSPSGRKQYLHSHQEISRGGERSHRSVAIHSKLKV